MRIQRIYLDTSVIGGCFDTEFKVWSNALMADLEKGLFQGVTSEIVIAEIADAPEFVQEKFREFLNLNPEILNVDVEALELTEKYILNKILPAKFRNDLLHIALATIHHVDILVSWNFKHIVRYDKIRQFNAINLQEGYHTLDIYSPMEVAGYGKD